MTDQTVIPARAYPDYPAIMTPEQLQVMREKRDLTRMRSGWNRLNVFIGSENLLKDFPEVLKRMFPSAGLQMESSMRPFAA
ncbi:hypothetical protein AmDm5_1812 [Acetobacter malorum]|uniref:Acetyl-CoA synthetase n=1 Tax=Acetobacter malorum TaxID=178901 RepID=A0A087PP10_9PROT|nr:hypothetical protein AmDm5_1812 [Acetobacter malorum]OAG77143.1 acetyl-CoA synthetase [Acetobacter malorum]